MTEPNLAYCSRRVLEAKNARFAIFLKAIRNMPREDRDDFLDALSCATDEFASQVLNLAARLDEDAASAFEEYVGDHYDAAADIAGDIREDAGITADTECDNPPDLTPDDDDEAELIEDGGTPTPRPDFVDEDDRPAA